MLLEKSGEISPERMKRHPKAKTMPSVDVTVMEIKSDPIKNNIA